VVKGIWSNDSRGLYHPVIPDNQIKERATDLLIPNPQNVPV
jgi:hypothetical protein